MNDIGRLLAGNEYPGRGIIAGMNGGDILCAYFIMGRSENSRNRVFYANESGVYTRAYDESKVTDPSLVIYRASTDFENSMIITNGDQTDTVLEFLKQGKTFEQALETREYEPDAPNYTPRISALIDKKGGGFSMSILKRGGNGSCVRSLRSYRFNDGEGRFIHTYEKDGDPLPPFEGEPESVSIPFGINEFAEVIWDNLNARNKISLYARQINIRTGKEKTKIINKHS